MNHRISSALAALGLILAGREAAAQPKAVNARVSHLIGGSIPLPADAWTTPPTGPLTATIDKDCQLILESNKVLWKDGKAETCAKLWQGEFPNLTITQAMLAAPGTARLAGDIALKRADGELGNLGTPAFLVRAGTDIQCKTCAGDPASYLMYFFVKDKGWKAQPGAKGTTGVVFDVATELKGTKDELGVVTNFNANGVVGEADVKFQIAAEATSTGDGDAQEDETCPPPAQNKSFCDTTRTPARGYLLCLDLVEGAGTKVVQLFAKDKADDPATRYDRSVLLPNRGLLVLVRHRNDEDITVAMQGEVGLFKGTVEDLTPKPAGSVASGGTKAGCPADQITERTFAPRKPGRADISVKLVERATQKERLTYPVELIVEETLVGAFRLGIAGVFNDAVDRTYEARTYPGSKQAEVAATSFGHVNAELVLGFAPYLFDYLATGEGRPAMTKGTGLAPYFGIGFLNANGTGVELVKSVHLGLEYQFAPSFSLAVTVLGRRVTRLAPGITVGSPVSGTVPTTTGFGFGGGLVLNFSPDFFKISAQGAATIFK